MSGAAGLLKFGMLKVCSRYAQGMLRFWCSSHPHPSTINPGRGESKACPGRVLGVEGPGRLSVSWACPWRGESWACPGGEGLGRVLGVSFPVYLSIP